jgi:hypothetical protein
VKGSDVHCSVRFSDARNCTESHLNFCNSENR